MKHHSREVVESVAVMFETGLSDYSIARATGVPRGTVQRWRRRGPPAERRAGATFRPDELAYPHLLGLYLGDGNIDHHPGRTPILRVTHDSRYPGLIESTIAAMRVVFPDSIVRRDVFPRAGKTVTHVCNTRVLEAFPQHGRGKKHERPITLAQWQRALTTTQPGEFIRGLLESDGCRSINRVRTVNRAGELVVYEYPRYYFTNYSADIRELFREHCALLGVHATQSNFKTLSVARRQDVEILDSFAGPKS